MMMLLMLSDFECHTNWICYSISLIYKLFQLPWPGENEACLTLASGVIASESSEAVLLLLASTSTGSGRTIVGTVSLGDGDVRYTTQPGSAELTTSRKLAGATSSSSRFSATWAAIRRCRSMIKLHLQQLQSFQRQRRLCPFRRDITPWFRHRAQRGDRMKFSSPRRFSDITTDRCRCVLRFFSFDTLRGCDSSDWNC